MIANLSPLYEKKFSCHYCETPFLSKKVRSGFQAFIKRDADFCTYYKDQRFNPIVYTVNVCPNCGYAFTDQFDSFMPALARKRIQERLTAKWTPKTFGETRSIPEAIATYKLAIYAAELKGEAHSVIAGLFLRLAWLHRFTEKTEDEKRFLQMAVNEYEKSYVHSDYMKSDKEMSEVRILYLIGELMRRVEQYEQAIKYFTKAIAFKGKTIETGIINMVHDQWTLARQEFKQKQQEQTS